MLCKPLHLTTGLQRLHPEVTYCWHLSFFPNSRQPRLYWNILFKSCVCFFFSYTVHHLFYYYFAAVDLPLLLFLHNVVCSYTVCIFENVSNRLWKCLIGADWHVHYMVGNLLRLFTMVWLKTDRTTRPLPEIAESA